MDGRLIPMDEFRHLVAAPAPFASVYVDVSLDHREGLIERLVEHRRQLAAMGISAQHTDDVLSAFVAPAQDHSAIGVVMAADGTTVAASSPDPLLGDVVDVGPVPRIAPIIEWQQSNVAHLVLVGDRDGFDVVRFDRDGDTAIDIVADTGATDLAERLAIQVKEAHPHVVFMVSTRPDTDDVLTDLRTRLPIDVAIDRIDHAPTGDLAEEVVRRCASFVAERQVAFLERFRQLRDAGRAVEGVEAVTAAVNADLASALLVHADPTDDRPAAIDDDGNVVALGSEVAAAPTRLTDALIARTLRSAGLPVIIPGTDDRRGPNDRLAVLLRT